MTGILNPLIYWWLLCYEMSALLNIKSNSIGIFSSMTIILIIIIIVETLMAPQVLAQTRTYPVNTTDITNYHL